MCIIYSTAYVALFSRHQTERVMVPSAGDRADVTNHVVLVTDGGSNIQQAHTVATAVQARIRVTRQS